ncbi:MAG: capsular biosynthesis protein [Pseudomonadota bacterium]
MAEPFRFVCLDPRKAKRRRIAGVLGQIGEINRYRLPPLSSRSFPETAARAEEAMLAARNIPSPGLQRALWLRLLGMQYNGTRALFEKDKAQVAVAWNGLNGSRRVFMQAAKDAGARTLYFELGPFPGRITVDPEGVNFVNVLPRTPDPYLVWLAKSGCDPAAWRALGALIKQRTPDQPPAPAAGPPPLTEPFIFAPLQVPGDSQLRVFGGVFRTVESFVKALAEAAKYLPDGWHLRLKEHPSTPAFVAGLLKDTNAPIYLDNATDTFAQVAASRGVVTVNSSVGLEAMFFDKPVTACGQCFWAIPGMAARAPDQAALNDAMAQANAWDYDPDTRNAVMSFLDQVYYPLSDRETGDAPATSAAKVAARIGADGDIAKWELAEVPA